MATTVNNPAPQFLDTATIESIDIDAFRAEKPFPWINPMGVIQEDKLQLLLSNMPEIDIFTPHFGQERKYGQQSHDHYSLEYDGDTQLPPVWQAFVDELCGDYYRRFVCNFLGTSDIGFRFQWHMAPRGAAVPPHCDSRRKIGTQIFYMNSSTDWQPEWGGQTLILDDHDKFKRNSNPGIEDFPDVQAASISENSSLIFGRGKKSWHAVGALDCPEGALRKVFIVIYEERSAMRTARKKVTALLKRKSTEEYTQNVF